MNSELNLFCVMTFMAIAMVSVYGGRVLRQADGSSSSGQAQPAPAQQGGGGCFVGDKTIQINETAVVNNLVFLCQPNGIRITGCVFTDDSGKLVQAKPGESVPIGGITHKCGGVTNPTSGGQQAGSPQGGANATAGNIAAPVSNQPCTYDNKEHKDNETWTAKSFRYRCENGNINIIACIIDDQNELAVGQNAVKFGLLHHCIKEGNRISYRSEICGVGSANCDPSAVGNTNTITNNGGQSPPSGQPGQINSGAGSPSGQPGQISSGSGSPSGQPGQITSGSGSPAGTSAITNGGNGTDAACIKDGQPHAADSTWVANNFKYNCHKDGSISIDACVTDAGQQLGLGEVWVLGGLQHTCSQRRNGAGYSTQLCGSQVQCGPDGLQQQNPQQPTVGVSAGGAAGVPPVATQGQPTSGSSQTEASLPRVQPVRV